MFDFPKPRSASLSRGLSTILVLALAGCVSFSNKNPPYVAPESGEPYATLSSPDSKEIEAWITYVDDRIAARNILGEGVASESDVYVSPGRRDVSITCRYFAQDKSNRKVLSVDVSRGKTYFFSCESNAADTGAVYRIIDEQGSVVPFTARPWPKY